MATNTSTEHGAGVSVKPLLKELEPLLKTQAQRVTASRADEIALAVSDIFADRLSHVQTAILLHDLYLTGVEQQPEVLAKCAVVLREAAEQVDVEALQKVIKCKSTRLNDYHGGLCDIVGTGGDHHSTFNISTASSILCSSLLLIAKHGNRASTSRSGSSDVLGAMRVPQQPKLETVGPDALAKVYSETNYAFLFAPNFHKGLRHVSGLRKELAHPTIFNLLGPLTNPAESVIEARVIGVKKRDLVPVYAEALRLHGIKKAMIVCGDEDLDEISCAGPTHCARLIEHETSSGTHVDIDRFMLEPADFGLPSHPLSTVSPGRTPEANAEVLTKLLNDQMAPDEPVLHFVLLNTAALFAISGACDGDTSAFNDGVTVITESGPGNGRWREGVSLARRAISTGRALDMLRRFTALTNEFPTN